MKMKITLTPSFKSDVRYYRDKKRYRKVEKDISFVTAELEKGNLPGDKVSGYHLPEGEALYKVRIPNSSISVGKSNGFRILYYAKIGDEIFLLKIYSKKDSERIPTYEQLKNILKSVIQEG